MHRHRTATRGGTTTKEEEVKRSGEIAKPLKTRGGSTCHDHRINKGHLAFNRSVQIAFA